MVLKKNTSKIQGELAHSFKPQEMVKKHRMRSKSSKLCKKVDLASKERLFLKNSNKRHWKQYSKRAIRKVRKR